MLTINLISQEKKKDVTMQRLFALMRRLNFILIIVACVISSLFVLAKLVLQRTYETAVEQTSLVVHSGENFNSKVKSYNQKINVAETVLRGRTVWTKYLLALSPYIGINISLDSIAIDGSTGIITLQGIAKTRVDLIDFKDGLEKAKLIEPFELTLTDILQKENVPFSFPAKYNLSTIK